jgi:hypothetical protein
MKKQTFPWIALGLGTLLAMILLRFGAAEGQQAAALPLLTTLFLCEFGLLVCIAGAYMGTRVWLTERSAWLSLLPPIACGALAIGFAWTGLALWQGSVVS